jgi:hypothetical protein
VTIIFVTYYLPCHPNMAAMQSLAYRRELINAVPSAGKRPIRARGSRALGRCSKLAVRLRTFSERPRWTESRFSDAENARCGSFLGQYDQEV